MDHQAGQNGDENYRDWLAHDSQFGQHNIKVAWEAIWETIAQDGNI